MYLYSQKVGLQIFAILFFLIFLIEIVKLELEPYINFGLLSLTASAIIAYSSYKTINEEKTKRLLIKLFYFSIIVLIASNLFLFEYISKYHTIFYSMLLGQLVLIPFLIKNNTYKTENSYERKIEAFIKNKYVTIALLILILAISFSLRIYNADIISPGRDSLHHYIAAKSINDNGSTIYETLPYINHMLAFIFRTFGETLLLARLPFIIAGTLSIFFVYLLGKRISQTTGIVSAILFALCPWAIGLSRYVRDYSLNILYELIFITLIFYFPKNLKTKKNLITFTIMNIIIYAVLVIFARLQEGLTISIIIALLIATFIRIFAELELYKKIKSMDIFSKEFNFLATASVFLLMLAILAIVFLGFDQRLTLTYQPKWFFFFLSESRLPVLWYTMMQVPWYFILSLTLLPVFARNKDQYVWASFLIFYAYLIFFVFIAKPHTNLLYARYIYPALPFFILLLGTSLTYLLQMSTRFAKTSKLKTLSIILVILFLGSTFSIKNTLFAADGTGSTENSDKQVISVPYRDYTELISFLEQNNFSKNNIVIASELRMKDTLAWYFDFDFYKGRNETSFNTFRYDIADNIYIIDDKSINVIKANDEGWIIRRDGDIFPKEISERSKERVKATPELEELNKSIEYLGTYSEKYEVYIWKTND